MQSGIQVVQLKPPELIEKVETFTDNQMGELATFLTARFAVIESATTGLEQSNETSSSSQIFSNYQNQAVCGKSLDSILPGASAAIIQMSDKQLATLAGRIQQRTGRVD